jgi:hypothetical protein
MLRATEVTAPRDIRPKSERVFRHYGRNSDCSITGFGGNDCVKSAIFVHRHQMSQPFKLRFTATGSDSEDGLGGGVGVSGWCGYRDTRIHPGRNGCQTPTSARALLADKWSAGIYALMSGTDLPSIWTTSPSDNGYGRLSYPHDQSGYPDPALIAPTQWQRWGNACIYERYIR